MKRIILILPTVLLSFFALTADAGGWVWGRGSRGNSASSWSVAAGKSGNVYMGGVSYGNISFNKNLPIFATNKTACVLAKYATDGTFLWTRNTSDDNNAYLSAICTDTSDNCYMLGWMLDSSLHIGNITLRNSVYPAAQYFVAKYNKDGEVIWASAAGGLLGHPSVPELTLSAGDTARMMGLGSIACDLFGNVYIATAFNLASVSAGSFTLTNSDPFDYTQDVMVVKYSSAGNVLNASNFGGYGADLPLGATVTPAGSLYVSGIFMSDSFYVGPSIVHNRSAAPRQWNSFIARLSSGLSPQWGNSSGGRMTSYVAGIATDTANNVYIVGGTADTAVAFGGTKIIDYYSPHSALFVAQLDTADHIGWHRTIAAPTNGVYGYAVAMSPGSVWVSGAFHDTALIGYNVLSKPTNSVDPAFIAGFSSDGAYKGSAVLQAGAHKQSGIACDHRGNVYLSSDYDHYVYPFLIANNFLPVTTYNQRWLYLAKYAGNLGLGPDTGDPTPTDTVTTDTAICQYHPATLHAPEGFDFYMWNDSTIGPTQLATHPGIYTVKEFGDGNDAKVIAFNVTADNSLCNCEAEIPNAFTPNGDAKNDSYAPIFKNGCVVSQYSFTICNRWGQCVFHSEDQFARWDGTYKGEPADMGVYMYYLTYTPAPQYPQHIRKGDVTLVR